MVKRRLNVKRVVLVIILIISIMLFLGALLFSYGFNPKDKNAENINFVVENGESVTTIFENLESKGIIKSALFMKLYSKLVGGLSVEAGEYTLGANMNLSEIHSVLSGGGGLIAETIDITFKEGRNVRDLGSIIEESGINVTKQDLIDTLKDNSYLDELIGKYWFLTDDVKNDSIYYSLEGYLFPDTYTFYKETTAKNIIEKMLDNTESKLNPIKSDINNSKYTIHELLTLASIVELESGGTSQMGKVASVFSNRLNDPEFAWSLGSCVTTYYAYDINMGDRELSISEISDCSSPYNTRCTDLIGLPVGPIGNAGLDAIKYALNPEETDYYYFVNDSNGDLYFTRNSDEHQAKIDELERLGLWSGY